MHWASDKTGAGIRLHKTNPSYLIRAANTLFSIVSVVLLICYAIGGIAVFCIVVAVLMKSLSMNRAGAGSAEAVSLRFKAELLPAFLIQDAPVAIVALDRRGSVLTWNRVAERMFGWSAEEAVGGATPIAGDSHVERDAHQRALGGETVIGVEVARRTKEGRRVDVGLSLAPVRDLDGQIHGVVEWMADHTAQKQMSRDLSRARASLRRAHGLASLFDWDMDVPVQAATRCDSLQAHFSAALRPEDRLRRAEAIRDVAATGRRTDISYRTVRPEGGETHFRERIEALSDESGQVQKVAGTAQDVTEYVYLQNQLQQVERLAAVGRLAAGVTHDFNNLVSAISGHNALLVERLDEHNPLREHALQIQAACERAGDLAHRLLAFSRGDAVRPTLEDLNSIVYVVGGLLQPLTGKHIEWVMRLDPAAPRIQADSGQIHQALVNLVLNAGEAMPSGGTLTIETASGCIDPSSGSEPCAAGPYALLAVSDTGTGFDEETRSNLFEPRFTTKQKGRARGFGLAAVRHIVTEAGGWMRVHGEPGKGARFEIYLPQGG